MHHNLKILPSYFEAILDGSKTFEIRFNGDRGFQKGDSVTFQENDPSWGAIIKRDVSAKIIYVSNYNQRKDWVVFGFKLNEPGK